MGVWGGLIFISEEMGYFIWKHAQRKTSSFPFSRLFPNTSASYLKGAVGELAYFFLVTIAYYCSGIFYYGKTVRNYHFLTRPQSFVIQTSNLEKGPRDF